MATIPQMERLSKTGLIRSKSG